VPGLICARKIYLGTYQVPSYITFRINRLSLGLYERYIRRDGPT
jgi:hypothetical protein